MPPPGSEVKAYRDIGPAALAVERRMADDLEALLRRQEAVVLARLTGPKARKGTRHWKADPAQSDAELEAQRQAAIAAGAAVAATQTVQTAAVAAAVAGAVETAAGAGTLVLAAPSLRPAFRPLNPAYILDQGRWDTEVADTVRPHVESISRIAVDEIGQRTGEPGYGPQTVMEERGLAEPYVQRAVDTMAAFHRRVQTDIERAERDGASLDEIVTSVRQAYEARRRDLAEQTAANVAVGAYNHSQLWTAARNPNVVQKGWLSKRDDKVRDSHREADGQVRNVDDDFLVGGYPMRFPGDPTAPLSEIVNCRCTLVFRVKRRGGRPARMFTEHDTGVEETIRQALQVESGLGEKAFDPSEPRNEQGEWTRPGWMEPLRRYVAAGYQRLNRELRDGRAPSDPQLIADLDRLIDEQPASTAQQSVWRGVIGDYLPQRRMKPGEVIVERGYASTSRSPEAAQRAVTTEMVDLGEPVATFHLRIPSGVRTLDVTAHQGRDVMGDQEVLLPRGSRFEVISDTGPGPDRRITARVKVPARHPKVGTKAFDPSEPRDERGRWSRVAGELAPGQFGIDAMWDLVGGSDFERSEQPRLHPERYVDRREKNPQGWPGWLLRQGQVETRVDSTSGQVPTLYDVTPLPIGKHVGDYPREQIEPMSMSDGEGEKYGVPLIRVPGSERPVPAVFRIVNEEEYQQALERGYLQTDARMNLGADEGTVASVRSTGGFYAPWQYRGSPQDSSARILRIRVHPDDGWRTGTDGYIKTPNRIPVDRIEKVTPPFTQEQANARGPEDKAFNPREPRDPKGRWTRVGGLLDAGAAQRMWDAAFHNAGIERGLEGRTPWQTYGGSVRQNAEAERAASAAKAAVMRDIESRMSDVSTEDIHAAAGGTPIVSATTWGPVGEQGVREASVSLLIQQWAYTSNDNDPKSLAMQRAAEEEFGVEGAAQWSSSDPQDFFDDEGNRILGGPISATDADFDKHGDVYRAFLRAQYEATQADFKAHGVKTVRVYRGVNPPADDDGNLIGAPWYTELQASLRNRRVKKRLIQMRPLSSWTTDPYIAYGQFGESGITFATEVPVERVLSTPRTGFGALKESEVVLLGGEADAVMANSEDLPLGWPETGLSAMIAALHPGSKALPRVINVDHGDSNADWIKPRWLYRGGTKAFNPDEPRDEQGRWTDSGADYRGMHEAPGPDNPSADDVEGVMPDFYTHPEYYMGYAGDPDERTYARETLAALRPARGKPDHPVTVYRSAPAGVERINPGDWVTTSRTYALHHGRHATDPGQDWPVLSTIVPARELNSSGDSPHEFGWNPRGTKDWDPRKHPRDERGRFSRVAHALMRAVSTLAAEAGEFTVPALDRSPRYTPLPFTAARDLLVERNGDDLFSAAAFAHDHDVYDVDGTTVLIQKDLPDSTKGVFIDDVAALARSNPPRDPKMKVVYSRAPFDALQATWTDLQPGQQVAGFHDGTIHTLAVNPNQPSALQWAEDTRPPGDGRPPWHLAGASRVWPPGRWYLAHEWGHAISSEITTDSSRTHDDPVAFTDDKPRRPLYQINHDRAAVREVVEAGAQRLGVDPAVIIRRYSSRYGEEWGPGEQYAEAFAAWALGVEQDNPLTIELAKRDGWERMP